MPTMNLEAHCVRIWKIISVSECRKPVGPTDGVDLSVHILLNFWIEGHGKVECVDCSNRL